MAEKDLNNTMRRRIASISGHLTPIPQTPNSDSIRLSGASINDSYHRKHGAVSTHPVVWSIAGDNSGKEFTDIIYEKAVGEAIAKVQSRFRFEKSTAVFIFLTFAIFCALDHDQSAGEEKCIPAADDQRAHSCIQRR